jgi:inorganic pyrophosphatase
MKEVHVIVDRPKGYTDKYGNVYPINYGYISGIIGGDNEEQDAYILDVDAPIKEYDGKVIAIIFRNDDVETKWVVANEPFRKEQILEKVSFMEKYFDSHIKMIEQD